MANIGWGEHKKIVTETQSRFFVYGFALGSLAFGLGGFAIYKLTFIFFGNEDLSVILATVFLLFPLLYASLKFNS